MSKAFLIINFRNMYCFDQCRVNWNITYWVDKQQQQSQTAMKWKIQPCVRVVVSPALFVQVLLWREQQHSYHLYYCFLSNYHSAEQVKIPIKRKNFLLNYLSKPPVMLAIYWSPIYHFLLVCIEHQKVRSKALSHIPSKFLQR